MTVQPLHPIKDDLRDLTIYLLVRTDIHSLDTMPGKIAAHALHAGNQLLKYASEGLVRDYIAQGAASGADTFSTCITLAATGPEIEQIIERAKHLERFRDIIFDVVIDPSYPFTVDAELVNFNLLSDLVKIGPGEIVGIGAKQGKGFYLVTRKEMTCAWFLGDRRNFDFLNLFKGLELHK